MIHLKGLLKNKFIKEDLVEHIRDYSIHVPVGMMILTILMAILLSFPYVLTMTHFGDQVELALDKLLFLK